MTKLNDILGNTTTTLNTWQLLFSALFQLVNHGVSLALVDKVKKEIQEFFNLSMEEKKKYWQYPGEVEGFGQASVISEEEKLD